MSGHWWLLLTESLWCCVVKSCIPLHLIFLSHGRCRIILPLYGALHVRRLLVWCSLRGHDSSGRLWAGLIQAALQLLEFLSLHFDAREKSSSCYCRCIRRLLSNWAILNCRFRLFCIILSLDSIRRWCDTFFCDIVHIGMRHFFRYDRLLWCLNDNCAETEATLRILTVGTLCCTFFTIALLLLRYIILSFHGKRRLLLLLGVNWCWHPCFFLVFNSTVVGLKLRSCIVWTFNFILTVASIHVKIDVHHLLIVLFLWFFDGRGGLGANLLVQDSTYGTIGAVLASSMGLLFRHYYSMRRRWQRSWITTAYRRLSLELNWLFASSWLLCLTFPPL